MSLASPVTRRRVLSAALPAALAAAAAPAVAAPPGLADACRDFDRALDAAVRLELRRLEATGAGRDPGPDAEGPYWAAVDAYNHAEAGLKAALRAAGRTWAEHGGRAYLLQHRQGLPFSSHWDPAAGVAADEDRSVRVVRSGDPVA